jgi:formate C-acetyltransferase
MFKPFDQVRARLERQYMDLPFVPESGLDRQGLEEAWANVRAEHADDSRIMLKARLFHLLCTHARLTAEPGDPFVGKVEHHGMLHALRRGWWQEEGKREFANDPPEQPAAWRAQLDCASHICPDWRNLLKYGFTGLRDRAQAGEGVFYEATALVFQGMLELVRRFHALQPSPALAALADGPPKTLHDALQLAYLYNELMELDSMEVRSMGRFDLLYVDFYRADLAAGLLTEESAKELLKYFWIKFFAKTQGKRFGKPFLFGPDANEFSRLAIAAFHEMRVVDPKFHIRIAERTAPDFLEQVLTCIQDGCTSMALVNDERVVETLRRNGRAPADAEDFILIGCYEPAVQGKELNCSGASGLNLAQPVLEALAAGDYPSFNEFLAAYFRILDGHCATIADRVRRWEKLWPRISPTPLLSGTMDSCLERGLDIAEAGAEYNTSGCCCSGLADAVDSLAAVEQLVYRDQRCTLAELRTALADNWEGHGELRLAARHRAAKWGNNDDRADRLAVQITDFLGRRINEEPNARNGRFQAALYGILPTVQSFGKHTGALPDGRRAGETLTVNTGAEVGMDEEGVTSLINSVTKIDLGHFPGGTVLDIMLHPSATAGAEGLQAIAGVLRSHFLKGGLAIQFNIFDAAVLREAQRHPEKYASLQVRVCGWNVHFSNLSTEEQNMFIAKAEAVQ